jgi:hypothetical protein
MGHRPLDVVPDELVELVAGDPHGRPAVDVELGDRVGRQRLLRRHGARSQRPPPGDVRRVRLVVRTAPDVAEQGVVDVAAPPSHGCRRDGEMVERAVGAGADHRDVQRARPGVVDRHRRVAGEVAGRDVVAGGGDGGRHEEDPVRRQCVGEGCPPVGPPGRRNRDHGARRRPTFLRLGEAEHLAHDGGCEVRRRYRPAAHLEGRRGAHSRHHVRRHGAAADRSAGRGIGHAGSETDRSVRCRFDDRRGHRCLPLERQHLGHVAAPDGGGDRPAPDVDPQPVVPLLHGSP